MLGMLHWSVVDKIWVIFGHEWNKKRLMWSPPKLMHAKEFELEDDPI